MAEIRRTSARISGNKSVDPQPTRTLLFSENRGAFAPSRKYIFDKKSSQPYKIVEEIQEQSNEKNEQEKRSVSSWSWFQSLRIALRQVFLPHGYPQSVSKDYVTYQIWDTLQVDYLGITK